MYSHSKRIALFYCALLVVSIYALLSPVHLASAPSSPAAPVYNTAGQQACSPDSGGELLLCALRNHPELLAGQAELKRFEAEVRRADQPANPQLQSRVLAGSDSQTVEAALRHTIEAGGKRDARVTVARENLEVARSHALLLKNRLVVGAAMQVMRLGQVREDLELLEESRSTYTRAVAAMRRRPGLSSEQRVNLATYEFAVGEARNQLTALRAEEAALIADLEFATGLRDPALGRALNVAVEATGALRWPAPESVADGVTESASAESEELRLARKRIARARALVDLEEALAFPDISIGPALEYRRSDSGSGGFPGSLLGGRSGGSETELGLSFRLTLPLYHRNAGGREAARESLETERLKESGVAARSLLERRRYLREYRLAFNALRGGITEDQIEARLRSLRATIRGGRVSPPAVIEFYRSVFEFHHARHDQELAAMRALLAIYVLDGRLLDKVENHEIL